jgi:hypothetical protein
VEWDQRTIEAVDIGLNEADVLGLRLDPEGAWCDLLLHVCALPEGGPLYPDARRLFRLRSPSQVRVLLRRRDNMGSGYGPVVPLVGLEEVEAFFASLRWAGSMYGWKFLDAPELTSDWPERPSLTLDLRGDLGAHSLYWFNECGRDEGDAKVSYCIEGEVRFVDLEVLRADGTLQAIGEFTADGRRYWEALHGRDSRLSVEAQQVAQAGTPSWRPYMREGTRLTMAQEPTAPDEGL